VIAARRPDLRGQRGFMLIESIVGVLVIAMVAAGVATLFAATANTTAKSKLRDQQTAVAQAVLERVQNREVQWMQSCAGATVCTICDFTTTAYDARCPVPANDTDDSIVFDPRDNHAGSNEPDIFYNAIVTAEAVDSAEDLTGAQDRDGVTPDYWQIKVRVTPPTYAQGGRPGTQLVDATLANGNDGGAVSASGTVLPATRPGTGAHARILFCQVAGQIDERPGTWLQLTGPDATCGTGNVQFQLRKNRICQAAMRANDTSSFSNQYHSDCAALGSAAGAWENANSLRGLRGLWSRSVIQSAGNVSFTLVGDTGTTYGPYTAAGGIFDSRTLGGFAGFAPGSYEVRVSSGPANTQLWKSHSIPAGGYVAIEKGRLNTAVQLFQPITPAALGYPIYFRYRDISDPWYEPVHAGLPANGKPITFKLIPAPYGRAPTPSFGANGGWTVAGATPAARLALQNNPVRVGDIPSGLYMADVWRYPGNSDYYSTDPCLPGNDPADPNSVAYSSLDDNGNKWRRLHPDRFPCVSSAERRWKVFVNPPNMSSATKRSFFELVQTPIMCAYWIPHATSGACKLPEFPNVNGGMNPTGSPRIPDTPGYQLSTPDRRGYYLWVDQFGAHRPAGAVITTNWCDDTVRLRLIAKYCIYYPPGGQTNSRSHCWAEDNAGQKVYLEPCNNQSPSQPEAGGSGGA
jgi:type II secretory pathway pseudopilin PulG